MSYQSLEDRIVKRAIAPLTVSTTPLDLPVDLPGHDPEFAWLTRGGAEIPNEIRDPGKPQGRVRAAPGGAAHQGGNSVTTTEQTGHRARRPGGRDSANGAGGRPSVDHRLLPPRLRAPAAAPAEDHRAPSWSARASR